MSDLNPRALDQPLRLPRICVHLLTAGLLLLAVLRAFLDSAPHPALVLLVAVVMAVVYAAGSRLALERSRRSALLWLAVLGVVWLVLSTLTPDGVWLAFPLFFLQMYLLPIRWGLSAVAVTTVVAVTGFIWHQSAFTLGGVIGPTLGAAVAIATVLGYQALLAESERRRQLIGQLRATRAELAAAEHSAGVLAERERLAREIHDTLAQGLSSIQLLLRAAERALPDRPEAAIGHVTLARETAQDNLTEARRFVRALTPMDLEGASLPAALQRLADTTLHRDGLNVTFCLNGQPYEVPTPYEAGLLRIAQQALANAVQHARATRADLTLSYVDTTVAMDVVDDGIGFDAETPTQPGQHGGGFGLRAMRSRVDSLGGTWSLASTPGHGTTLAVSFPRAPEIDHATTPSVHTAPVGVAGRG
ncbi:MAG: sensor histidine kinase [Allobranchiibius sp.]